MNTEILTIMLVVSVLMGLIGLIAFLWGVKSGQFDDEKRMLESVLYDSASDLNEAISQEKRQDPKN
ncbi:cbb3-type cytochrome oxidase assembly protein CcoS [Helicobacter pylori]|uniref:Cation transport subunit forcbb3-type oxidase n=1 Tax=Helicobacter pylori Aklavik86 TaxID=1055532 RepID=K7Z0B8_HELPX|nr:cbb3-type cytochrome oxidase assembly protein CcoS [Helicobacter pylori]AFX89470.1 cation transport subunit forcbb3-type oxidase [Helicobacter pylori Aklavik86]WQS00338.1 cbb3-type cytochrome oxidase assembly protein CcoS [Helicobacter pylori]WQS05312.1 cbb3-type cytochrome oxidase assembly protein CcoS [Helicobacter pylori]WQS14716.1 cbb3-type cytochrome oxidase assembly protein CcoS [Helicobacter pylori]WQS24447.1 cbb3-type cytochrome oxidase assembly protein CcoS [Helicobacter pylori]